MLSQIWPFTHNWSTHHVEITSLDNCQLSLNFTLSDCKTCGSPSPSCLLSPASCHFHQHRGGA